MSDCVFCRILGKEIPSEWVFEDEHAFAVLDINPCSSGHTVVVPKVHATSILELSDGDMGNLFKAVKEVTAQIGRALKPDSFNVGLNDGPAAGQGIPHVHVHIIPRYKNDKGGSMHTIVRNPPEEPLETIAAKIRKERIEIPKKAEKKEEKQKEIDISGFQRFRRP